MPRRTNRTFDERARELDAILRFMAPGVLSRMRRAVARHPDLDLRPFLAAIQ